MITSTANKQVKHIIQLQKKARLRREENVFIAEGPRMVIETPKEMLEEIRKELNFTSLKFHRLDDLKASIGISPCKLCTYCWDGKE